METSRVPVVPATPPGRLTSWDEMMEPALAEAALAAQLGEVPVGAALFSEDGELLCTSHNRPITSNDPTAHAEISVLRTAATLLGNYRLPGTILAVTLEPCLMCFGAMVHARIAGLVFGAPDPKTGVALSRMKGAELDFLNHRFWIAGGVSADRCGDLLKRFFQSRRT
jgi:tRNA(adenine34) deaminase